MSACCWRMDWIISMSSGVATIIALTMIINSQNRNPRKPDSADDAAPIPIAPNSDARLSATWPWL